MCKFFWTYFCWPPLQLSQGHLWTYLPDSFLDLFLDFRLLDFILPNIEILECPILGHSSFLSYVLFFLSFSSFISFPYIILLLDSRRRTRMRRIRMRRIRKHTRYRRKRFISGGLETTIPRPNELFIVMKASLGRNRCLFISDTTKNKMLPRN